MARRLVTTLGPLEEEEAAFVLPHEHVFVDFRLPDDPLQGVAETSEVARLMAPELAAAGALGVTALVECTPVGLGRRADILRAVSAAAGVPVVAPTGVYREPYIPTWVHGATEAALNDWMLRELEDGIEETGVRAGWIKLSAGDDGLTGCERKVLRAAARAAAATGAVIGSHTQRGRVALEQLDMLEAAGLSPERFIWIHTQLEPDLGLRWEIAGRGAWLEYDAIGDFEDGFFIERIHEVLEAGFDRQLLLSQDRGWYDPAVPGGGSPRPYTYLQQQFLPKLLASGVDQATVDLLTGENPFRAFAR